MEQLVVAVVIVVTLRLTFSDDESCGVSPMFNTREQSSDFLAKSMWSEEGMLYKEESVFMRKRHCPVRVRVNDEATKVSSLGNGSHNKESSAKKNNSNRKLKGSKRKRKKEKRKRFKKKKKSSPHTRKK